MGVPQDYWDPAYRNGSFLTRWDYKYPAQEMIGALSALDLPDAAQVLDLGCGGGRDAIYLAQCGFRISAVDFSAEAIGVCLQRSKESGVDVDWRVSDVLELPFGDSTFDLVCDRACFHHIADADRDRYAREVFRVLKPSARLLLRGSRESRENSFYAVDADAIRRHFLPSGFLLGRIWPIMILNNSGSLLATMVILTKP